MNEVVGAFSHDEGNLRTFRYKSVQTCLIIEMVEKLKTFYIFSVCSVSNHTKIHGVRMCVYLHIFSMLGYLLIFLQEAI